MWIARDKDGGLCLFENMPVSDGYIFTKTSGFCHLLPEDLFPEVTFSNSPRQVSLTLDLKRDCFDAEKFVDNEMTPVETRNGKKVTIYSIKRGHRYSVVGEIEGVYKVDVWTASGFVNDDYTPHEYDLMFCEKQIIS